MNSPQDFDSFLDQAWDDHAEDAAGVAARLASQGLTVASAAGHIAPLAQLAHHVWGEHLGDWATGRAWLVRLGAHDAADDVGRAAVARCTASLDLSEGRVDPRGGLTASERIRVVAMAAANLAERDTPRASMLFEQALAEADGAGLADSDPMHRALAVTGNNLACTLEEKPRRSAAERQLMIRAAQAARRHWAIAGTWRETARAESRLAMSWLQAGEPSQARHHARLGLELVLAQEGPALEQFLAWAALGRVDLVAGNQDGHQTAQAGARAAFGALADDERVWCQEILDQMAAT
ncbi:conserved hypothetical protein [Rubrivivax sp. A210]|uniref:hypothetical protein n=1 Tax=Rubrivivax sp. A210 TaxID=2772301 RepID=UPI0019180593|nr:hypothetical protein [Rubrivivax sp. A210]CAD5372035.1 conserved hypothetical protein [Rubrivivax sp. A210]